MIRAASCRFQRYTHVNSRLSYAVVGVNPPREDEERRPAATTVSALRSVVNPVKINLNLLQARHLSTESTADQNQSTVTDNITEVSFDDTMNKLFSDSTSTDAATSTATVATEGGLTAWDPTWYNLPDQALNIIQGFHNMSGLDYGLSIIGVTFAARVVLLPLFIKAQQNTSRMAHMQPELQAIKAKIDNLGPNPSQEQQVKYGLQMKALFAKYNCNPLKSLVLPFVQAPLFISMFLGLRKMPDLDAFHNDLTTGGLLWFPDLTVTDPLYILPVGSAVSFFLMIEVGKEQMMASSPQQGAIMINVFRAMSIVMIPIAINFHAAILCYWMTNNTFSLGQSIAFKNPTIRKQLGIWDPPKPVPGMPQSKGIVDSIQEAVQKAQGQAVTEEDRIKQHNDKIEVKNRMQQAAKTTRDSRRRRRAIGKPGQNKS